MAVIEYDEYKQKLQALEPTLGELEKALGIPKAREELAELQKETEQEGFWNDLERSQQVSRQVKRLENKIKKHDKLVSEWEDTLTLCEMAQEEDDPSQLEEVVSGYETLEKEISERRLAALLSGEYDANNAILTFHAGAGGTEAQDWTEMLYRMYTRWAERHGYTYQLMDYEAGDEAGIKSATILIEGENAYGYLKSENGVHRLVRVSPFDANARRQTSFAALEVMPELDILYMTRVQKERFFNEEDYIRMKDFYVLDAQKMELAPKDMYVLHPLPRVNEIAVEVDDDPRAAYFAQAQYGVYIRMALILTLLEIEV